VLPDFERLLEPLFAFDERELDFLPLELPCLAMDAYSSRS
jgi:hypothetical protein